jgi:hypothetical protein
MAGEAEVEKKGCVRCRRWLALHWFNRDRRHADGRGNVCSDCRAVEAEERSRHHAVLRERQAERGSDGLARVTFEEAYGGAAGVAVVFHEAGLVQTEDKRWDLVATG